VISENLLKNKRRNKVKKIFAYGQYGRGNIGDDLMFLNFMESIDEDVRLCGFFKLRYWRERFYSSGGVLSLMRSLFYDEFVIIGGNTFVMPRIRSYFKLIYWFLVFFFRRLIGKKNIIKSFGVDLPNDYLSLILIKSIFFFMNSIETREEKTFFLLRKWQIRLKVELVEDSAAIFLKKKYFFLINDLKGDYVVYYLSHHSGNELNERLIYVDECLSGFSGDLYLFAQSKEDFAIAEEICDESSDSRVSVVKYDPNYLDFQLTFLSKAKYAITERFHGAVICDIFNVCYKDVSGIPKVANYVSS